MMVVVYCHVLVCVRVNRRVLDHFVDETHDIVYAVFSSRLLNLDTDVGQRTWMDVLSLSSEARGCDNSLKLLSLQAQAIPPG